MSAGFTRPCGVWVDPPLWRKATAWGRLRPSFLIIGAQRSGTTSLYRYLCTHPDVLPALRKEVHYYDFQFAKGAAWYGAHFPARTPFARRGAAITGEASPYYMVHPLAPARARADNPHLKIIAILRDPVARAYSHYRHERGRGVEPLGFAAAIDAEAERLRGSEPRLRQGPHYYCHNHHHFAHLDRGRYGHYLSRWLECFPARQVLVLSAESLLANPNATVNAVFEHLGLASHTLGALPVPEKVRYPALPTETRARLAQHFAEDQRLLAAVQEVLKRPTRAA